MKIPLLLLALASVALPASAQVSFKKDIAPILLRRCAGCHGERTNLGDWRAHTFSALTKPGSSGAKSLVPGKPEASELYQRLIAKDESIRMPKSDDPLAPEQLSLVKRWIAEGAKFDGGSPTALLKTLLGPRTHPAAPPFYRTPVPILSVAFVPGGKALVVGGYNEVTVWSATSGALLRRIGGLPQRIQSLSFSPDGKTLLVAGGTPGEYGEVTLVSYATGQRRVLDTFNDLVLAASFNSDGSKLAAGGAEASVRTYDAKTGVKLWSMSVHSDWITSVAFSGDGKFLASASRDKTVKVYDVEGGSLFTTYNGHNRQIGQYKSQEAIYALRFQGSTALSVGAGKWIQEWDPIKAKTESGDAGDMEERFFKASHARHLAHGLEREVFGLCLKDNQLFALSAEGRMKQFDLTTQREIRSFGTPTDWAFAMDVDLGAQRVVTGDFSGQLRLFDLTTSKQILVFSAQPRIAGRALTRTIN